MAQRVLAIALCGAAGSVLRFLTAAYVQRWLGGTFPVGTLVVNATGCFLFGLLWVLSSERGVFAEVPAHVAMTGFLGGYTTFSAFAFEAAELLVAGRWVWAGVHLIGQVCVGLAAMFAGMALGRV